MSNSAELTQLTLYGIKSCDTIKKARQWLERQGISYKFHDYRTDGLNAAQLQNFIRILGWQALLNTRGTTWRKLSETIRKSIDNPQAASVLMLEHPTLIKRPLLETLDGKLLLGFMVEDYQQMLVRVQ